MNDCCKETYKKTLEEVINHISSRKHKSFVHLIMVLQYVVDMLNEPKKEVDEIILNKWNSKL